MKVLVSTKEKQGLRKNDFCHVPDGELLAFSTECDGESVDGNCGCRRSFSGIASHKGTTTAKVVEASLTRTELKDMLVKSITDAGWNISPESMRKLATDMAKDLVKLAAAFPTGSIVEKRGNTYQTR